MANLKSSLQWAKANPNDPRTTELLTRVKSGSFDDQAKQEGVDIGGVSPSYKTKYGQPAGTSVLAPKQGILGTVDQAIEKPAFDMSQNKSGLFGTLLKSAGNFAKDLGATAYGMAKAPLVAAKNIAYDIPKAVFGKQNMGATAGTVGGKPVPSTIQGAGKSALDFISKLPEAGAKAVLPPAVQDILPAEPGAKPFQFTKAIQSIAEKPVSNILPPVLAISGLVGKGGLTTGSKFIDTAVEKVGSAPGEFLGKAKEVITQTGRAVADRYEGSGLPKASPEVLQAQADSAIRLGMQKGVKPTIIGKQSLARQSQFYDNAKTAVKTIAENRGKINIINPETGEVVNKPQTNAEFSQALDQGKKLIYDKYSAMSKAAGEAGAKANVTPVIGKLFNTAFSKLEFTAEGQVDLQRSVPNVKYSPELRKYALDMVKEIGELQNADPTVLEARIKDLNSSLAGYYEGRTTKAKAQLDASVAGNLRAILDQNVEEALNQPGYQDLKNQYGALRSLEKDVNKRAIVTARQNIKGLPETLTDIWSGAEIVSGLFGNPTGAIKGVTSNILMRMIKQMNAPDTYIKKMFDAAYDAYPEVIDPSSISAQPASSNDNSGSTLQTILPRKQIK